MAREGVFSEHTTDWVTRVARLQPWYLLVRFPHKLTRATFAFVGAAIAIGIISVAAVVSGQPLVFPSLGPSAFLFLSQPTAPANCPRNVILSHGSGILIGWGSYWIFAHALAFDTTTAQVATATLSLGLISAWMLAAKLPHAPAASTTLIVSLGLMVHWQELIAVMVAVVLLTAECCLINRLSGIVSPLWAPHPRRPDDGFVVAALQTDESTTAKDGYSDIADLIIARQKLPTPPSA